MSAALALDAGRIASYLGRIHVNPSHIDPATLRSLSNIQWRHMQTIPFENLSLRVEKAKSCKISTNLQKIFQKVVLQQRGGYCYEVNGLLSGALRGLDFDMYDGSARVAAGNDDKEASDVIHISGHDHQIIFVTLEDGMWMVDVGFGSESPPLPIKLPSLAEAASQGVHYWPAAACWERYARCDWAQQLPLQRLSKYRLRLGLPGTTTIPTPSTTPHYEHRAGFYLQKQSSAGFKDLYFFRLDEFIPQDFAIQDHYIQTSPTSHFTNNLLVALHTTEGRYTISNEIFRVFRGDAVEEYPIRSDQHLEEILLEYFGINLQAAL